MPRLAFAFAKYLTLFGLHFFLMVMHGLEVYYKNLHLKCNLNLYKMIWLLLL